MLECLKPDTPSGSGADVRHAAPASESSSTREVNEERESEREGVSDGGERVSGNGEDGSDERDSERTGEKAKHRLVTHTCWVKSGHEVAHEREPFLRALLHKVRKSSSSN